jgi:hypothetical protein
LFHARHRDGAPIEQKTRGDAMSILGSGISSGAASPSSRRDACPLFLRKLTENGRSAIRLAPEDGSPVLHDEAWLRDLLFDHPELLPIRDIEPVLDPLKSACIELPMPAGNADNLFLNPAGGIALVECKLWRNPESRRKVVAQMLDYARCLTNWRYEDLEAAVARASCSQSRRPPPAKLTDIFQSDDFDETAFVDGVNRNLKLGRMAMILAGDGIREDAEALVGLVQGTAGARFTWALLEMPIFRLPDELGFIVQPRLIARTVLIERGVVKFSDNRLSIEPPSPSEQQRSKSITEEEYFEALGDKVGQEIIAKLRDFVEEAIRCGVYPVFKGALNLRWTGPDGIDRRLGYIQKDGQVWFDLIDRTGADRNERDAADRYLSSVAAAFDGAVKNFPAGKSRSVYVDDHAPRIINLPQAADGWLSAIRAYTDRLRAITSDKA